MSNDLVKFNDGEELVEGDFNDLQNALTERAWEIPGCSDLMAFEQLGKSYLDMLSNWVTAYAHRTGVFTKGGGLMPSFSGASSYLSGGLLGTWDQQGTEAHLPQANSMVTRSLRWAMFIPEFGNWSYAHDSAATGKTRYDIVTCRITETSGGQVTRTFEDATTGKVSAQDYDKRTMLSVDLDSASAVTKGAETTGTPSIPAVPTGRHLLYYVLVNDSGIVTVHDCTIPAGPLLTAYCCPSIDGLCSTAWIPISTVGGTPTGGVGAANAGEFVCPVPVAFRDPSVRILGVAVQALFTTGTQVTLRAINSADLTVTTVAQLGGGGVVTSSFGMDSVNRVVSLDLRGPPAPASIGPWWGNGKTTKENDANGDRTCPALHVSAVGAGSRIYSITWYGVRG
jgi:hypothetical protein